MLRTIPVTVEQVEAARLEVAVLEAVGLHPEPLVRLLAKATLRGARADRSSVANVSAPAMSVPSSVEP